METNSKIEEVVMRRVRTIHKFRPFVGSVLVSSVVAVFALYGLKREVWVARVFENVPGDLLLVPRFFIDAFLHTEIIVQVCMIAAIVAAAYIVRAILGISGQPVRYQTV